VAAGELILDVVVGRAAAAVEQPRPAKRVRARADAGDGTAAGVMAAEPAERVAGDRPRAVDDGPGPPPGHDDEVLGAQPRPLRGRLDGNALRGGNVAL